MHRLITFPIRALVPQAPGQKPLKYVNKDNTDIRVRFELERRRIAMQNAGGKHA